MAARAAVLLLLAACIGAAQGQLVIEQAKRAVSDDRDHLAALPAPSPLC